MDRESIFRAILILAVIALAAIRFYYQAKIIRDRRKVEFKEGRVSLIAGSIAALTNLVFGAEYIFFPGVFWFAYLVHFPDGVRWLGSLTLAAGVTLLGLAHHHLGKSFHSLVVTKENQVLVETGPYRWIRHPIYTAYLMSYLGGGLLAGNWVLTVVPAAMFAILVAIRMGKEERAMEELFGPKYIEYEERTGRLLPRIQTRR